MVEGSYTLWASLVAYLVNNWPAMWETWVQSLGWEDPLEKGKATHFSILVCFTLVPPGIPSHADCKAEGSWSEMWPCPDEH